MKINRIALAAAIALTLSACGTIEGTDDRLGADPDTPVLQVTSEGGFAPVEMILGSGPRYTLLADGSLIHEGPVIAIFPGPLLPNYQVTRIDDQQMRMVLDLVDDIGLPNFEERRDDSQASMVADATTEVVTYWDEDGKHTYAVYALGIEPDPSIPATAAFAELVDLLGQYTAGEASPYEPELVRVIAGPGLVNAEFEDVRDWPLEDTDLSRWDALLNGWVCQIFEQEVLEVVEEATQATVWRNPGTTFDTETVKLLVRPLHPGEPDCPDS